MKLQNYQTKFLYNDFVLNVVEQAVSRINRSNYSRPAVVQQHTTFRFFDTSSSDLYLLLASPVDYRSVSEDYIKIMKDSEEYAKYPRPLDLINYDVILSSSDISGIEGYQAIRHALTENRIEAYSQLNTVLSTSCNSLLPYLKFDK